MLECQWSMLSRVFPLVMNVKIQSETKQLKILVLAHSQLKQKRADHVLIALRNYTQSIFKLGNDLLGEDKFAFLFGIFVSLCQAILITLAFSSYFRLKLSSEMKVSKSIGRLFNFRKVMILLPFVRFGLCFVKQTPVNGVKLDNLIVNST